eukprot:14207521-Ditylum_brightwellii.AAC.1
MDSLAYAATTSNNLWDENAKLLKIVEVSACAGAGTVITPAGRGTSSGKNSHNQKKTDYEKTDHLMDPA